MIHIRARMVTVIWPRDRDSELKDGDFIIGIFRPCDVLTRKNGEKVKKFTALGNCVPSRIDNTYDLYGNWERTTKNKDGFEFRCENYKEVIEMTEEGIIGYLSSGLIKGIGPKTAQKIYDEYGVETLDVLDKNPEALLRVKGIGGKSLDKIIRSYTASRGARDIIAFLAPHGVTANFAIKVYNKYDTDASKAIRMIKANPYELCNIKGIGFKSVDKMALNFGILPSDTRRLQCAVLYALRLSENDGNMCLPPNKLIKETGKVLFTAIPETDAIENIIKDMIDNEQIVELNGLLYRVRSAVSEYSIAKSIAFLLKMGTTALPGNPQYYFAQELASAEYKIGMTFDTCQRKAIELALTSNISIITGGPGTGKTSIQKAIIMIFKHLCPGGSVVCCAPTGRAARRMEESNGYESSTIHHLLQIHSSDMDESLVSAGADLIDSDTDTDDPIEGDLIIVDECSMIDSYLFERLLNATTHHSHLVLIGDADQLPSVGPGAVFHEMIKSHEIPVVWLNTVHRQNEGSLIALNAQKIKNKETDLYLGTDFQIIEENNMEISAAICAKKYKEAIKEYGLDEVAMLTPFRQRTETGANQMNIRLRDMVNPQTKNLNDINKSEIQGKNISFRLGDRVMHLKNWSNNPEGKYISNGDIGYIARIYIDDDDMENLVVDYMDGRVVTYTIDDLDMLTLGYAMSVHKSQGSEYDCVILNLQMAHYIMLNRPLIYTAITRAKKKLIIVGERKALKQAIYTDEAEKRYTCLSFLIKEACSC